MRERTYLFSLLGRKTNLGISLALIVLLGIGWVSYRALESISRDARDRGIDAVCSGAAKQGFEVDDAVRAHIEQHGYGEYFIHRTGHSIGTNVHGAGANMDNFETHDTRLLLPFVKWITPDLGAFYVVFAVIVLVFASNGVNMTDGLDGLAISTFAVSAATFTALTYVTGHSVFAEYLLIVYREPVGELTIFCGALVGASLGFLWWNAHPAEIFMGDVGSLALGGALGTVAILIKQELLLPIVGGVFVMEGLSVIIQVVSFKLTGRRVFRMSPIHHHFELAGWQEPKIIMRFLILAIIFALLSLTTLKIR